MKVDATKRDHKTGSNQSKTVRTSGAAQQSAPNDSKKEAAPTEHSRITGKGTDGGKLNPTSIEKNHSLKNDGGLPNPTVINVEEEWTKRTKLSCISE